MRFDLRCAGAALLALGSLVPSAQLRADDGPAKAAAPLSLKLPGDVDGVLLDDGRQIEGEFEERANQRWIIQPKAGGRELNVSVTQIVVAEKKGEVEQRGIDSEAAAVWRLAVRAAYCNALEKVFDEAASASLVDKAKAVIQKMKESGADSARLAKLTTSLSGKSQTPNPDLEKSVAAKEGEATAALVADLDKGVAWCKKREFLLAATSMLNEIAKLDPSKGADCSARAKEMMPATFFFKAAPDAVAQWQKWADALLPSSAQFVGSGEDASEDDADVYKRLKNAPWTDGQTLAFRTANVLLFIRDQEPRVCGKALRLAEQVVRALQIFLNDGEPDLVTSDSSRLEIRIHKSRADYLAEEPADGGKKAEEWTAGFFSPVEGVSHFYVDRDGKIADLKELTRVLTHEFTHHYVSMRWMSRIITARGATPTPGGPGYWVVEGIAEFVQNQSHHMDERAPQFDDDQVDGNRDTAGFRKAGYRKPGLVMERFIDMNRGDFAAMENQERALWYDMAGTLSYFFLQKKGPEMRKKYVRYTSDHYAGIPHKPAWQFFGYSSAAELDNDFQKFLDTIALGKK